MVQAMMNFGRGYKDQKTDGAQSSRTAYDEHKQTGVCGGNAATVMSALHESPGCTAAEIALCTGLGMHEATSRLCDLAKLGLVRRGFKRACTVTRSQVTGKAKNLLTWWPV